MKIPKLFKKAAAFVMAAVTALSIMPATAFAAGDIGTISFSHTYDSNGNAMRYNSSANIGGYTAGGTGNYKYRMFVDGENAFCIQPGVPLKTGNILKKASSDTWNALSANQKKAVGLAPLYGYQGNRNNLSGSDDEKWLATQTLVWEFVTGCREATGSYNQTSTTVYSLYFGSNYANSGARAVYDQIVAMLREHNTIPSFMSGGKNDITKELAYKDGKYSITLTDSNGVLSDYSFSSSDSNVSVSKSGNKLIISSTVAISGSVRITAKRNNVPTVSSSAKLIAYGDPNLQDLVTGVENADTVSAYINIETPTGTIALKKTSEDGVVEGISFTIKGDNFNKTVKTGKDGSVSVEGLFPGTYTVTEQSIDCYEPQKTQTVTLIGGKTSTVTFSNTLKRGSLEIVKTSEDNLVEGMKFHLYGTSLSGLPVDEYAVTDKNGLATVIDFEQLGVDRLFIDESHFYKNLYLYTKMRNVGGIAQTEAQKSSDLFMKCRYLDEITGNRGTVFATGTPVSNSMVELYSVQRYLQYDTLAQNGLQHFDSWASTFGETVTALELAPEGTNYRAKTRFAKFYNLPELMQMFREVADIQTADMLKLPVPKVNYHNIKTKPSEIQTEMAASLAKRAEKVRARLVEPNIDNMLKITNDGRKLALDQRMIDPMLPDDPDSKVNACVDNVYRIWEEHADTKATQLVFCDLSTPKNDGTFNVYDDMREKLIARGIPAEQIRFIHEATTDAQKKELFGKVRSGEVRVLFGSTPKMGAGTNVQDRLIAIHNLDCPWRPSDVGRILRTFKIKKNVEVTDNGKDNF
ncbi:MAG: SpaA isopeptide-forming pilin-related protein [Lachnospiraceae bacterium]|nr:MAG: SpaA isopeptide-forming pilin-related protein [Lachnospiraceae bacterium]